VAYVHIGGEILWANVTYFKELVEHYMITEHVMSAEHLCTLVTEIELWLCRQVWK